MPRACSVCGSPAREAVDRALVAGEPYRGVAKRYGLEEQSVFRHKNKHLVATVARGIKAEAKQLRAVDSKQPRHQKPHPLRVLDQVREGKVAADALRQDAMVILDHAREVQDLPTALEAIRTALAALRESNRHLELLGKANGEIPTAVTITLNTILQHPDTTALFENFFDWLKGFPAAKTHVLAMLDEYQAKVNDRDS